jgi:hypothetical protein
VELFVIRSLAVLFVVLVVVAVLKPEVRDSRLVRIGAAVLFVISGMVSFVPGLGTGLLFLLSAPPALLLILIGTLLTLVKTEKNINRDIVALILAAKQSGRAWPDHPPLRQIDPVANHGMRAGPALVALLRFESDEQLSEETWSPHIEQQAELALCRIYGELPAGARTVYDLRATPAENKQVKQFWEARVRSAGQSAGPPRA